jgi:hypothetical protein
MEAQSERINDCYHHHSRFIKEIHVEVSVQSSVLQHHVGPLIGSVTQHSANVVIRLLCLSYSVCRAKPKVTTY